MLINQGLGQTDGADFLIYKETFSSILALMIGMHLSGTHELDRISTGAVYSLLGGEDFLRCKNMDLHNVVVTNFYATVN